MLLLAHHQDRAGRLSDNPFRGAADKDALESGESTSPNRDQVRVDFARCLITLLNRRAAAHGAGIGADRE